LELRQSGNAEPQEKAVRRSPRPPCAVPRDRSLARRAGIVEDRQCAHRRRHRVPWVAVGSDERRAAADRWVLARSREIAGGGKTALEGGGGRGALLRAFEPHCRPAL